MILEEFDLEKYLKLEKKESRTEGYIEGHATGLSEGHAAGLSEGHAAGLSEGTSHGRAEFATLTQRLLDDSRIDDLKKAAKDSEYLELLLKEYHIVCGDLTKAAVDFEYRDILLDEYKLK